MKTLNIFETVKDSVTIRQAGLGRKDAAVKLANDFGIAIGAPESTLMEESAAEDKSSPTESLY